MIFKKYFFRIILSLFVFNSLSIVAPVYAMKCRNKCPKGNNKNKDGNKVIENKEKKSNKCSKKHKKSSKLTAYSTKKHNECFQNNNKINTIKNTIDNRQSEKSIFLAPYPVKKNFKKDSNDFELWCRKYSFNKKVNKNHDEFVNLLEAHKKINNSFNEMNNLKISVEEFYKEIFAFLYNNFVKDKPKDYDYEMNENELNDLYLLLKELGGTFGTLSFSKNYSNGIRLFQYKYSYPCIYVTPTAGNGCPGIQGCSILTITFGLEMLYEVDLKFERV